MPGLQVLNSYLPWSNASNNLPAFENLSEECQRNLVFITSSFQRVQKAILYEIETDLLLYKNSEENKSAIQYSGRTKSLFDENDIITLKSIIAVSGRINVQTSGGTALCFSLADVSYLDLWEKSAMALLSFQGMTNEHHLVKWQLAKQRAQSILDMRSELLVHVEDVEEEIKRRRLYNVYSGIREKLNALHRFLTIYERQPYGKGIPEPLYTPPARENQTTVFNAYPQLYSNQNSTLIACIGLVVAVCIIPMILAWRSATSNPGAATDVDFWLLVQSSIMQLLGLFTTIFPMYRRSAAKTWLWIWVFAALGSGCAITAVPLYLYIATIWSSLLSFLGSASQAYMSLQLAMFVNSSPTREKKTHQPTGEEQEDNNTLSGRRRDMA